MKRMSDETNIESWKYIEQDIDDDKTKLRDVSKHISVYEFNGPLFFAVAGQISMIKLKSYTKCVVLRMRSVTSVDTDALKMLEEFVKRCSKKNITVIFSHVNEQPRKAMKKSGLYSLVKKENFCENIDKALERAETLK